MNEPTGMTAAMFVDEYTCVLSVRHKYCIDNDPNGNCLHKNKDIVVTLKNTEDELRFIKDCQDVFAQLKKRYNSSTQEEMDEWCLQNYKTFLKDFTPETYGVYPFIVAVRANFNCDFWEAKDTVKRCKPFMEGLDSYAQFVKLAE